MKVSELQELKRLAESAGGGQWEATLSDDKISRASVCHGDGDVLCTCYSNIGHQPDPVFEDDIAHFIAAANPKTILALVAEIERLRAEVSRKTVRALVGALTPYEYSNVPISDEPCPGCNGDPYIHFLGQIGYCVLCKGCGKLTAFGQSYKDRIQKAKAS